MDLTDLINFVKTGYFHMVTYAVYYTHGKFRGISYISNELLGGADNERTNINK